MKNLTLFSAGLLVLAASAASAQLAPPPAPAPAKPVLTPDPSWPIETVSDRKAKIKTNGDVFIKGGRILTASKGTIEKGNILVRKGKIVAIGNVPEPAGITVIDATGKVVAPGFVDSHIHRGSDVTNEGSDSIVAEARIFDVLNPDLKNVWQAVASGETTGMLLHGSANSVGAESQVIKLKYGRLPDDMLIPDAPRQIKFALGENVTRSGGTNPTRFPRTRMGVEGTYRRAFTQAKDYIKKWDDFEAGKTKVKPAVDLRLQTLADILKRKVWIQCHGYRADEHLMLVRLSQEFGFKIGALQHAVETYKIAPELAKAGVGVSIFDEWAAKLEIYDGISAYASAVLHPAGVLTSYHTDGTSGTTAININAAKAMRHGGLTEEEALRLITLNPAKQLGIDHRVGSLEVGKDADIVVWNGHPLSVYAKVNTTLIDGEVFFQERDAFNLKSASTFKTKLDKFTYVPTTPVLPKARAYVIIGATVHTVNGSPIENGMVLVRDGKIVRVGSNFPVAKDAVTVNAKGMHVFPGFIDAGTSMGLTEFGQVGQATDANELGSYQPDLITATAVNVQSEHIPVARVQGVTTVFTAPTGGIVSGFGSVLNLLGGTREEMTLLPKAALVINWPGGRGSFDFDFGSEDEKIIDDDGDEDMAGAQAQAAALTGAAKDLDDYFEKAAKYGRAHTENDAAMEAMQPLFRGEATVFIRARNAAAIREAVAFIKKRKLKAVLVGAPDAWKEAKLLADAKIPVIIETAGKALLTANVTVSDWDPYDTPYALPALLQKAGVKFAFMTDDYAESMNLPRRAAQSCAYGLSPTALLRALTQDAADILGVGDKLGSISPGKIANLVISDGDPFEQTSNIRYVFINGQPVPLTSKHTRLRDQYLQRLKK